MMGGGGGGLLGTDGQSCEVILEENSRTHYPEL